MTLRHAGEARLTGRDPDDVLLMRIDGTTDTMWLSEEYLEAA